MDERGAGGRPAADLVRSLTPGQSTPRFRRIGLVGHSAGGQITETEAASFRDVAAAGVLAYSDIGMSDFQMREGEDAMAICRAGGQPVTADPGHRRATR